MKENTKNMNNFKIMNKFITKTQQGRASVDSMYEGCSGSSWNLVIKFLFIDIILSFF